MTMGMEFTIVEAEPDVNLADLYRILDVVREGRDWYLGNDPKGKLDKFIGLSAVAEDLTRDEVLSMKMSDNTRSLLKDVPVDKFNIYLDMVKKSIGEFREDNSHLFFDYERIPNCTDVYFSCSYSLLNDLRGCHDGTVGWGDVVELDPEKVREVATKWNRKSFSIKFAKWIGYFWPAVKWRILTDIWDEFNMGEMDAPDMLYHKDALNEIAKKMKSGKSYWLVVSY